MAFLLQVWVIVLWGEALCFGKLHQIHLAIGIPFLALSPQVSPAPSRCGGLIVLPALNRQGQR